MLMSSLSFNEAKSQVQRCVAGRWPYEQACERYPPALATARGHGVGVIQRIYCVNLLYLGLSTDLHSNT